jgi:predicted nucleic acid-binding protein
MITAIDTNIVSAIWTAEPSAHRIAEILDRSSAVGRLTIAAPAYAELLAYPGATPEFVGGFLHSTRAEIDFLLNEGVWREAGLRFGKYAARRRSSRAGAPRRLLADFIIGAHALLRADRLLTLDVPLYARDFPELRILTCD